MKSKKENKKTFLEVLGFPSNLFDKVLPLMELKKFKKKDILIDKDFGSDSFFIVKSGIIRSYIIDEKHKEFIRTLYTSGMPLASIRSIRGDKPILKFDCLTDCELYVGSCKELHNLAFSDIEVARNYMTLMELEYLIMEDRIFELTMSAEKKYGLLKDHIPDIENLIPQYQIASYLNITNVQLSRIRKKLLYQ